MATWKCGGCGARYQLRLFTCPRCHGHEITEEGAAAMTLKVCKECSTPCAADLPACPHCNSTDLEEEGAVPKITVHGGATNGVDEPVEHEHPGTGEPMEAIEIADGEEGVLTEDGAPGAEDVTAEGDDVDNEVEPDAEPAAPALPRPAANASKADWLAYVRQETGEDIGADDYTKAELTELVGKA